MLGVGFQIEIERIFSLAKIFTNSRRCGLQIENLEKLIFINKKWPNDPRISCKSPSNLVEFFERNVVSIHVLSIEQTILLPFTKEYRAHGTNNGISQFFLKGM